MSFQYSAHNQILRILEALNHSFFSECSIFFGDGTMLVMAYGEYRLKRSILMFQSKPDYRLRCYERLQVSSAIEVIDGLDLLAAQFKLPKCNRLSKEVA